MKQNDYYRKSLSGPALELFRAVPEYQRRAVITEAQAIASTHDLMNVTSADVRAAIAHVASCP